MKTTRDIAPGRLPADTIARNFCDLHEPFDFHEARIAAERCLFCYDAPCVSACPTSIDIPLFIRQIATSNTLGAAKTILDANIMGGMCARVCPTEILCEEACVRNAAESTPVEIGRLQRYATDALMASGRQPYTQGPATGRRIAVVGAGPAGLSCAHKLATLGHSVVVFEARPKAGGLNEYGIAAYKTVDDFAAREVAFILGVGGITVETGKRLGRDLTLDGLTRDFDAVFLGVGLDDTTKIGIPDDDLPGIDDAVSFIVDLRQSPDLATLPIGRRIVVIGGGMTAIDAAVQTRKLGAEEVTIVYRRGAEDMGASRYEQELALSEGVVIRHWMRPKEFLKENGELAGLTLARTAVGTTGLVDTGETVTIACDQVLKAIGQVLVPGDLGGAVATERGRIVISADGRTSLPGVWAGGDCTNIGDNLTVEAVAQGKRAAISIDRHLQDALKTAAE
jgi:dihydropyrimidine dehydrogenase (NAD+) subunit PreT